MEYCLSYLMNWCYEIAGTYFVAIILFTLCTKIVLLPISLWTYKNSIIMLKIQPDINQLKIDFWGQKDRIAEEQLKLYKREKYHPLISIIPTVVQLILLMGVVNVIKSGISNPNINMVFGKMNLATVPSEQASILIWPSFLAGVSSLLLCISQNHSNVLQSAQSAWNKYGTMLFSVCLSVYLGWFVPVGTVVYWVSSNLFAIMQTYIFNAIFRPKRFVNYDKLKETEKILESCQQGKKKISPLERRRERNDYRRFFSIVNKHLVFYSEKNGYYKYFKGVINYLLQNTNIIIHYITSDANDDIFQMQKNNDQIKAYYIGDIKLITLMMKMDADVVVMTMPDLNNFQIKKSYVREDVEYIYMQHGMGSNNMCMRNKSTLYFDTVFCAGKHQLEEEQQIEDLYQSPHRNLVKVGYPLIDELRERYTNCSHEKNANKRILIAPSWQKDNIIDNCLEDILDALKVTDYQIVVRPHPQEVKQKKSYIDLLKGKYENSLITIQTDFSGDDVLLQSDLLITDWSGISWEFAFSTLQPILFVNTPMKVANPEYTMIDSVPINISLRDRIGISVDLENIHQIPEKVEYLFQNKDKYQSEIEKVSQEYLYNIGCSAEIGAQYIIETIKAKIDKRRIKK